ncbi:flagellar basal-body rod protein FlgF [Steroidobacter flavus]|uniref:Flagellar basal-body rod protein FlgF n=1 Tax=Steroidobacter flavus TaxID=1842136 RepID=A0ABV8SYI0_9GAMM
MFGSIYTALAGMNAYSQGLNVISNNVANLNTPGFKVSDPLFREIVYRQIQESEGSGGGLRPQGAGVEANAAGLSFGQGELRDTGNDLDVAIDGSGFFVLEQDDGSYRYTRAGQLTFNDDGILVERTTGTHVLFNSTEVGNGLFDITDFRSHAPKATNTVMLSGTLARTSTSATYELPTLTVFDSAGTSVALRGRFTRSSDDPLSWTVELLGSANTVLGSGTIAFNQDGTPAQDRNSVTIPVSGTGVQPFDVIFNFGAVGSYAGVSSPATSTSSALQMLKQDGMTIGSLTGTSFDEQGQLKLSYSNGQIKTVGKLVLAQFENPEQLKALGGGMFTMKDGAQEHLGQAMVSGIGRVVGRKVEMSNVDLTRQFTDLIILQRGYQASSQVSSIANELIQTLLAMDAQR